MKAKDTETRLIQLLKNLPERELIQDLTPLVLQTLEPKRLSLLRRMMLRIRSPRVIIITPLRATVAASMLAVLLILLNLSLPEISLRHQTVALKSELKLVPVTFSLADVKAQNVFVIGSFNRWQPEHAMKFDSAKGRWVIEIALPPGEYEYVYLVDNRQVIADPKAEFFKKDKFGSRNSLIFVTSHDDNFL